MHLEWSGIPSITYSPQLEFSLNYLASERKQDPQTRHHDIEDKAPYTYTARKGPFRISHFDPYTNPTPLYSSPTRPSNIKDKLFLELTPEERKYRSSHTDPSARTTPHCTSPTRPFSIQSQPPPFPPPPEQQVRASLPGTPAKAIPLPASTTQNLQTLTLHIPAPTHLHSPLSPAAQKPVAVLAALVAAAGPDLVLKVCVILEEMPWRAISKGTQEADVERFLAGLVEGREGRWQRGERWRDGRREVWATWMPPGRERSCQVCAHEREREVWRLSRPEKLRVGKTGVGGGEGDGKGVRDGDVDVGFLWEK